MRWFSRPGIGLQQVIKTYVTHLQPGFHKCQRLEYQTTRRAEKVEVGRRKRLLDDSGLPGSEIRTDEEAGHCISIGEVDFNDGSQITFGITPSTSQFDLTVSGKHLPL